MVGASESFLPYSIPCSHIYTSFESCSIVEMDYFNEQNYNHTW